MVCKAAVSVDRMNTGDYNKIARNIRKQRLDRGVLYKAVRSIVGLSQSEFAPLIGTSRDCIVQRERSKRLYSLAELVALQRITGYDDAAWCSLIRELAK